MRIGIILRYDSLNEKTTIYKVGKNIKELKNRTKELNKYVGYNGPFGKGSYYSYELHIKYIKEDE